jgi:hypothetical protein
MLTLKDVTIYPFYEAAVRMYKERAFVSALKESGVEDYQQLYELIESGYKVFHDPILIDKLEAVSKMLRLQNNKDIEPTLYSFDTYNKSGFNARQLSEMDKGVSCDKLILLPPTTTQSTIYNMMNKLPIEKAKNLLSHIDENGDNAITNRYKGISTEKAPNIARAIKFYEEQLIRQVKTRNGCIKPGCNAFYFDEEEKRGIVTDNSDKIIQCLASCIDPFIWGALSEYQKIILLESLVSKSTQSKEIRKNIINMVTYNTTKDELEQDMEKTIKRRFIVDN